MHRTAFSLADFFSGSALGTLVGDAFGSAVEGWPPNLIRDRHGILKSPLGGRYTDDTEMMIGIMESLIEDPSFSPELCARKFFENYDPARGYGTRIAGVMRRIGQGLPVDSVGTDSFGNGAAMRVAPIGFFFFDDHKRMKAAAIQSAMITHRHPLGIAGAVAQATAVGLAGQYAMNGETIDPDRFLTEIIGRVKDIDSQFPDRLERIRGIAAGSNEEAIDLLIETFERDVTAPGAVPAAIASFLLARSFTDAVIVAVNAGGDTDTIAAMAGAIAGGYFGASLIPGEWLLLMENGSKGRDYIRECAIHLSEMKRGNYR